MADAIFSLLFESNFAALEKQVAAGLRRIQNDVNKSNASNPGFSPRQTAGIRPALGDINVRGIKDLQRLQAQFDSSEITARKLRKEIQAVITASEKLAGKTLAARGVPKEIAAQLRSGVPDAGGKVGPGILTPLRSAAADLVGFAKSISDARSTAGRAALNGTRTSNVDAFRSSFDATEAIKQKAIADKAAKATQAAATPQSSSLLKRPTTSEQRAQRAETAQEEAAQKEGAAREAAAIQARTAQLKSQFKERFRLEDEATSHTKKNLDAEASAAAAHTREVTKQLKAQFADRFALEKRQAAEGKKILADEEAAIAARTKQFKSQFQDTSRREGQDRLRGLYSAPGKLNEKYTQISPTQFSSIEAGQKRYFQIFNGGLHDITNDVAKGMAAANREAAKLQAAARAAEAGSGGGGFFGGVRRGLTSGGFGGNGSSGLSGIGQALGSTAKYSLLYDLLGLVQTGLAQVGKEMLNVADSETDLEIALGNGTRTTGESIKVTDSFRQSLESIAGEAGANVGDVMDIAAAGIRSVGLEAEQSQGDLEQLALAFTKASQVQSVLAKTTITDAAGNLRAIQNAFNVPLESASRINDAIAQAKNIGGGQEKDTAQALASFGESAKIAGFSIEEAATLASRVQASTDQTGSAVGNKLSRLVSIVSGSAGQAAIAQLNSGLAANQKIDTGADARTQLLEISRVYDTLSEAQKKSIGNSLGGTSAFRELQVVLKDLSPIIDDNGGRLTVAGAAADEYAKRLQDLSAKTRELRGALHTIVVELSKSGLLDPLIAAFIGIVEGAKALAGALQFFNQLPAPIRKTTIYLLELYGVLKLINAASKEGALLSFAQAAERLITPKRAAARLALSAGTEAAAGAAGGAAAGAAGGAAAGAGAAAGGAAAAGEVAAAGGLAALAVPAAIAVAVAGVVVGLGQFVSRLKAIDDAMDASAAKADDFAQVTGSAADQIDAYKNIASQAATQAGDLKRADNRKLFGFIPLGATGTDPTQRIGELDAKKNYAQGRIQELEASTDAITGTVEKLSAFGDPAALTAEKLSTTLDQLAASGVGAEERMKLLNRVLNGTGVTNKNNFIDKANRAADLAENIQQAGDSATPARTQAFRSVPVQGLDGRQTFQDVKAGGTEANPFAGFFERNLPQIQQTLATSLPETALKSGKLRPADVEAQSKALKDLLLPKYIEFYDNLSPQKQLEQKSPEEFVSYLDSLAAQQADQTTFGSSTSGGPKLTGTEVTDRITAQSRALQDALQFIDPQDLSSVVAAKKNNVAAIRATINQAQPGAELSVAYEQQAAAERDLAESQIAREDGIRKALQARAKTDAQVRAIGKASFKRNVGYAVKGGSVSGLLSVIDGATKGEINIARGIIEDAIKADRLKAAADAAVAAAAAQAAALIASLPNFSSIPVGEQDRSAPRRQKGSADTAGAASAASKAAKNRLKRDKELLDSLNNFSTPSASSRYSNPSGSDAPDGKSAQDRALEAAQLAIARRNANAVASASLDQAKRAVADAKTLLSAYKKKDAEYYQQLAQYNQAKDSLAQALKVDYRDLERRLKIDLTNPLQVAKADLKKTLDALAVAKRQAGRIKDPVARDAFLDSKRLDVRNSRVALENAKQSQYLSDLQTKDSLGDISHTTYLNALQKERDRVQARLNGMKKTDAGYRQTLDYLNTIRSDIKAASDSLEGQFNIGDIKLPTPYEVRRQLAEASRTYTIPRVNAVVDPRPFTSALTAASQGAVTNNTTINGADFAKVKAYIDTVLGVNGASRNTTTSRRS